MSQDTDETPPVPANFGFRYVIWVAWYNFCRGLRVSLRFLWENAISVLSVIGAVFTAITLDPTVVAHNVFHYILIGNFALTAILAQINRKRPDNATGPLVKPPEKPA